MIDDFANLLAKKLVDSSLDRCSRWAEKKIWLPKPYEGYMGYKHFPWLREILDINEGFVTAKKASQMGFTIAALAKALHLVIEVEEDVAYILPTANLVSDFSKGRLAPILQMSPDLTNIWLDDSVYFRKTMAHKALYIRGSRSEAGLVGIPLGYAICDELDRCNDNTLALLKKRFSARESFYLFALSTPTCPGFGVDAHYAEGTQELFMFKCPGCSRHIHLKWPECVEICGEHHADPECADSYYKCPECGHKLPHELKPDWLSTGKWEQTVDVQGHRSFHMPQMYSPGMSAEDIVREFLKGEISEVSRIEFTNQTLGETYLMDGASIQIPMIEACLKGYSKRDQRPQTSDRLIVMGVDAGSFLDVVVQEYLFTGEPGYEPYVNSIGRVLWEGRVQGSDWGQLDRLMAEWQIKHCCIDFQPETQKAKEFARRFPGFVSLVQYRRGTAGDEIKSTEDEYRTPILTVDRTMFLDMALGRCHRGTVEYPQDVSGLFKEHIQEPTRTYELDSEGRPRAIYLSNKDDHMAHSLAYCEVAFMQAYENSTGRTIKPTEAYHQF